MASRRRYISTEISHDSKLAELSDHGTLPLLLYTWAIPHADDWGRMSGDPRQFKLTVCPALDVSAKEVDEALDQIAACGLWLRYTAEGRRYIAFPIKTWFHYQSYIGKEKRQEDGSAIPSPDEADYTITAFTVSDESPTPQNTADHRETPQNAPSRARTPSPSPSPSPSPPSERETSDAAASHAHARTRTRGAQSDLSAPTTQSDGGGLILETEATLTRWRALSRKQRARLPSPDALHGVLLRHHQRGMSIAVLNGEILKLEDEAAASPARPLTLTRLDNWLNQWHAPTPEAPERRGAGGARVRGAHPEPPTMIPASQANQWWLNPLGDASSPPNSSATTDAPTHAPTPTSRAAAAPTTDTDAAVCLADALRSPPTASVRPRPPLQVIQVIAAS